MPAAYSPLASLSDAGSQQQLLQQSHQRLLTAATVLAEAQQQRQQQQQQSAPVALTDAAALPPIFPPVLWPAAADASVAATAAPATPPVCVLVVDDDASSRAFLARALRRALGPTATVLEAPGGDAAVATVMATTAADEPAPHHPRITVVCLDREMPGGDGPSAARELRRRGWRGGIVGVTGALMPEEVAGFISAGADVVTGKPVQVRELREVVERLSRSGGGVGGWG